MTKQRREIEIKNKFVNHLITNGKKNKSEKIVYASMKALQTISTKSSKKLTQLALVYNTPIFKLNTITQKKRKKKQKKQKIYQRLYLINVLVLQLPLNCLSKMQKKKTIKLFFIIYLKKF